MSTYARAFVTFKYRKTSYRTVKILNFSKVITIFMDAMDAILKRRTIRKYLKKSIPEEIIKSIVNAGLRAPCGSSLQKYSIIWVQNEEKRKILWECCMKYASILDAPVTLAICADLRKIVKMIKVSESELVLEEYINSLSIKYKLKSIFDAGLVAENITLAAESYGLGSVFIGSAFANLKVIETLKIPIGVFPICLLCIGYPDEDPPLRPRLPLSDILFVDEYEDLTKDENEEAIKYINISDKMDGDSKWIEKVKQKLSTNVENEKILKKSLIKTGYLSFENLTKYLNEDR